MTPHDKEAAKYRELSRWGKGRHHAAEAQHWLVMCEIDATEQMQQAYGLMAQANATLAIYWQAEA